MLVQKMKLWEEENNAYMTTYILDDSVEFRKGKKLPAVIVCPGGAYLGTSDREAEPVALRFTVQGMHAFVLRYNTYFKEFTPDFSGPMTVHENSLYPNPLYDLGKAIATIREHADEWLIDADKIAICGFSAGGNLVGNMSVHWHDEFMKDKIGVKSEMLKPNATIMGYPVLDYIMTSQLLNTNSESNISKVVWQMANMATFGVEVPTEEQLYSISPPYYVSEKTSPTFIWHTANDDMVFVQNSLKHAMELSKHKIPYELHVFEDGVHGLSLADETTAGQPEHVNESCQIWFDLAATWLKKQFNK